jgi:hypothetical protein
MTHTPGPWVVPAWPSKQPPVLKGGIDPRDSYPICKTIGCLADSRANAQLIAAAPDLYAALKALCDLEDHDDALVQAGLAAIAKAEKGASE